MTNLACSYAKALYELQISLEEVSEMEQVFGDFSILRKMMLSPVVLRMQKEQIINRIFTGKIQNFLKVLNKHNHLYLLDEIFLYFREYYDKQEQISRIKLFYVEKPSEFELSQMIEVIKDKLNKQEVVVEMIEKRELLEGFLIQTDNWELDWSLQGRFQHLKDKLTRR